MPATARTSIPRRRCSIPSPCASGSGASRGLHVAIVGDILFTRVARSNIHALTQARRARHAGRPEHARAARVRKARRHRHPRPRCRPAAGRCDQSPAHPARAAAARSISLRSANTPRSSASPKRAPPCSSPSCLIMHPGPINRGVEIDSDVADSGRERHPRPSHQRPRRPHGRALPLRRSASSHS